VPKHHGSLNAKLTECLLEQLSLRERRPDPAARSRAVAEAGSVKHDDPVASVQAVHETADREILDEGAIAVDQHHGVAVSLLDVVEAHAVYVDETSNGRGLTFCGTRLRDRIEGGCGQGSS
jgi:hypothetical protein